MPDGQGVAAALDLLGGLKFRCQHSKQGTRARLQHVDRLDVRRPQRTGNLSDEKLK